MNYKVMHNGEEITHVEGAERIPEKDERLTYTSAASGNKRYIVEYVETFIVNGTATTRIHVK